MRTEGSRENMWANERGSNRRKKEMYNEKEQGPKAV
jgi:hypothetical protein